MDQVFSGYSEDASVVVIIGGGPAGMSCALWVKNYGLRPVIVEERDVLGGLQAQSVVSNTWLLGWQAVTGAEIAASFERHVRYERIQTFLDSKVVSMERVPDAGWAVDISRGLKKQRARQDIRLFARAVVVASGTRFAGDAWLGATPGAEACQDRILLGPASYMDPSSWFGNSPTVIGGGDSALECACFLAARGSKPIILARSETLRAGDSYRKRLEKLVLEGQAILRTGVTVTSLRRISDDIVEVGTMDGTTLETETILLMLGYEPNIEGLIAALGQLRPSLDENGFIKVGADCQTDVPGLFAIGDVANPRHPCTATAIAMGTMAARGIVLGSS